ncbi:MAG: hypothetical protein HY674_06660, partial [Chloroflexi bacterium]|nr:hypothetical protein [Chloroflexota bacterium]
MLDPYSNAFAFTNGYEVDGMAQFRFFGSGIMKTQAAVTFKLSVHDGKWSIRYNRQGENGFDYEHVTFDGRYAYYLTSMETMVKTARAKGKDLADNVANAFVTEGENFHNQQAPEVGVVWLAFASSTFFDTLKTNRLAPPIPFDGVGFFYDTTKRTLNTHWERFDDSLRLPSTVVYFDDGRLRNRMQRRPPYDKGFTNCVYSVKTSTNVNGVRIPLTSGFTLYRPRTNGLASTDLEIVGEYDLALQKYRPTVTRESFTPDIPGITAVFDSRVTNRVYRITNSWPSKEEILSNREYIKTFAGYKPYRPASKPIVKIILLAVLISPLVLAVAFKRKPERQTNKP